MRKVLLAVALLTGCASMRYPNWEHVRIEYSVPDPSCQYKVQEACGQPGAKCFVFYKKRATIFDANTVVITTSSKDLAGESSALVFNGAGGGNSNFRTDVTSLADYYACPARAPDKQ
jgi:hypothetical protein